MPYDAPFSYEHDLGIVKLFLEQQPILFSNIKTLKIEKKNLDGEIMIAILKAEHLNKLTLTDCNISFEHVTEPFSNLESLDLSRSKVTFLMNFLEKSQIQNTLKSLNLDCAKVSIELEPQSSYPSFNFQKLEKLVVILCNLEEYFLENLCAPALEKFKYGNLRNRQLSLNYILKYPTLKHLILLGDHRNSDEILELLKILKNLEIFRIEISSSILAKMMDTLLVHARNLKLAMICCADLMDAKESLEQSLKECADRHHLDFELTFYKAEKFFIKLSNASTTIAVHDSYSSEIKSFYLYQHIVYNSW